MEEFRYLLKEKYGIEVKERRGRFSYLHPERSKFITGHALGSDFEKEHVEQILEFTPSEMTTKALYLNSSGISRV